MALDTKRSCWIVVLCFAFPVTWAQTLSRETSAAIQAGVIVDKVAKNFEGEKAGIHEGDILLRWARGDVHGQISTPFDLVTVEIEQAPRGVVRLEGLRGDESREWNLGQDLWQVQARPNFSSGDLTSYRKGEEYAAAGKVSEAADVWRTIAGSQDRPDPHGVRKWLLFHVAEAQARARDGKAADQAYQDALQSSLKETIVAAQIRRAWGEAFMQRNDWANASEQFHQAVVIEQAAANESLALALTLDQLGELARKQGDLSAAEGYYARSLHMRENLAPNTLAVVASMNHLGELADYRGALDEAEALDRRALTMAEMVAPGSLYVAQAVANLGDVAYDRGNLAPAKEHYTQSLAIYQKVEPDSLDIARAFDGLGQVARESGDLAASEEHHRRALAIRGNLAPQGLEFAQSLAQLGRIAVLRGDLLHAEEYLHQTLAIRERLAPGSLEVAASLFSLGNIIRRRGDLVQAERYLRQALAIREKLAPQTLMVATTLNSLGNVVSDRGDLAGGEDYYTKALAIKERCAPGSLSVSRTLTSLGNIARLRGDLAKSEEYYRRSWEIGEKLAPGSLDVATSLASLAGTAEMQGDLVKAEDYGRQALGIREKLARGSLDVAASLIILGIVAWERGDMARAGEYHRRALAITEKLAPGSLDVAWSLEKLGLVAWQRGELTQAADFHQRALAIREKLAPSSLDVALSLNNLGVVERELGDLVKAETDYRRALSIREKLAPVSVEVAWNLNRLAEVVESLGDLNQAEQCYAKALAIWEELAPGSGNLADTLAGLASIRRQEGRPDEAAQFYERAVNALESQSARLGGSSDIRAGYRAKHENCYREYIDLLLEQNKPAQAFEVLERSRARTLLETLSIAHVDIHNGVDPELISKERSLQADIKAKSERRIHMLAEKSSAELVGAVEKEISALTGEYQDVASQIRSTSPVYAALTQPQPLSTKEIQEQLLAPDTVLLEFSLGEERSYLFLVSAGSLEAFELPKRAVIEAASRQVYELLTARNRREKGEKPAERAARIAQADSNYPKAAARLSRMLLAPIAEKIEGKRLLIVSDGALHDVSFAGLPIRAHGKLPTPLAAQHEIVNLPSASVLAVLRAERTGRTPASKIVAVLADPVFGRNDIRVKLPEPRSNREVWAGSDEVQAGVVAQEYDASQKSVVAPKTQELDGDVVSLTLSELTRSAADVGWKRTRRGEVYLPRLQSTRREADAIVSVTPAGKSFEALDFKANRTTATSPELANYRIVHFATHALLNNKHPELSGLVLSLVDQQGRPQSGFLGLEDIYNLNLPAELVVLSACETALGKDIEGEGMVGLTRGFMYAGASRVMASLWKIDDRATADQMKYFYRAMIGQGMRPAAALRSAQLKMRRDPRWSSPYFWAAFQIQGEWK